MIPPEKLEPMRHPNNCELLPEVLSMDVDGEDDCEYRLRFGQKVKYLLIKANTYESDILGFPPALLPKLPPFPEHEWNVACISRDSTGEIATSYSHKALAGVRHAWHSNRVNCLSLQSTKRYTPCVREVMYKGKPAIAKFARFEFEIDGIDTETQAYRAIDGLSIAPKFLGHLTEDGRIMGLIIEKVEGRMADIDDLVECERALRSLHSVGVVHGDVNRYNFLVGADGVKIIDFEHARFERDQTAMQQELDSLPNQLREVTGRGAPWAINIDIDRET